MAILEKLQIFLITYNREKYLFRTLSKILASESPIRDFDITIIDNASTDNTPDIIQTFQKEHANLKHLRNRKNIGGNANIVRALESGSKDYVWVLCDDDDYDWSGWPELEAAIQNNEDIICVCNFNLKPTQRNAIPYLLNQMTFLPSIVIKTCLIDAVALRNMYDNIFTMFPHLVPIVSHFNKGGRAFALTQPVVVLSDDRGFSGFLRGYQPENIFKRARSMSMPIGFANIVSNLTDKTLARKTFITHIAGDYPERLGWPLFFREMFIHYKGHDQDPHFTDLFQVLPWHLRIALKLIHKAQNTPFHTLLMNSFLYKVLKRHAKR